MKVLMRMADTALEHGRIGTLMNFRKVRGRR